MGLQAQIDIQQSFDNDDTASTGSIICLSIAPHSRDTFTMAKPHTRGCMQCSCQTLYVVVCLHGSHNQTIYNAAKLIITCTNNCMQCAQHRRCRVLSIFHTCQDEHIEVYRTIYNIHIHMHAHATTTIHRTCGHRYPCFRYTHS